MCFCSLCQIMYGSKWAALKLMSNGSGQNGLAQRGFFMLVSAGSGGVVMSTAVVASTLTGKSTDTEANWEKIILNFKKELAAEEEKEKEKLKLAFDVVNSSGCGSGGIEERDGVRVMVRAKFSVPLSRREME
ncbi:hypothetical protein HanIR_Chr08g0344741 [Helianthus annuus]|nr:hypothetical protein HanIR_Chr08g0344741 [Helianthus annuus]